jgi:hypothetical protein
MGYRTPLAALLGHLGASAGRNAFLWAQGRRPAELGLGIIRREAGVALSGIVPWMVTGG